MKTVSVSDLKTHLSRYLREVRRGGEVQVLDRGVPVARLSGLSTTADSTDDQQRRRLVSDGIVRPGEGDPAVVLQTPALDLPANLAEALEADRADRL